MSDYIPFNKAYLVGKELFYISQAVLSGKLSGNGDFTKKCSRLLEETFQAHRALLTTSCTTALEMSAILCKEDGRDEFIVPSFTFVSTANAFVVHGYQPRFIDVRPDTLNLDESKLEAAITDRTRAIIAVHYAGVACEMDKIREIAKARNIAVIEDAAQAVGALYKGQHLGTLGDLGTYSFHDTKNYICGEGGALIINDPELVRRAEIIWEKGTNRFEFMRGNVDKYTWVDVGGSYLPSEVLSAFLLAQLEARTFIWEKRRDIYARYQEGLSDLAQEGRLQLPVIPDSASSNFHMFYILLEDNETRTQLIEYLKARQITAVFHYIPLHTSPMGLQFGQGPGSLPVTESIADRLLRLPMFIELRPDQIDRVIEVIHQFFRDRTSNAS